MFQKTSKLIDPKIKKLASRYDEPGKQLLLALPVATAIGIYEVNCSIVESKPLQILEEFVLKAALNIRPSIHWRQLANVLKVDTRFISDTKSQLQRLNAITSNDMLEITEQGENFYRQGSLNSEPKIKKWYILSIPSINRMIAIDTNTKLLEETDHIKLDTISEFNSGDISLEDIIDITTSSGLRYHDDSQQIVALNSIQHMGNGYLEWGVCSLLDWISGDLMTLVVRQPQFKLEATDLENFYTFLDDADIISHLFEQVSGNQDVVSWSPNWYELTERVGNLYKNEIVAARNHEETTLKTGTIQRIDNDEIVNTIDTYAKQATSVVFINLSLLDNLDIDTNSLFADLAKQRIFVVIIDTTHLIDTHTASEINNLYMLDNIPAVHLLSASQAISLAMLVDRTSIFIANDTKVRLRRNNFSIGSLLRTNESDIVRKVIQMLSDSLDITDKISLWGQFAVSLMLNNNIAEVTDLLIQQDVTNVENLIRYWSGEIDNEKAEIGLSNVLQNLKREFSGMSSDDVEALRTIIRNELFIIGNDGELKYSSLIDRYSDVFNDLGIVTT